MHKIEPTLANNLIEKIWDIQDQLKTAQSALSAIEHAIACEVLDEG